MNEKINIDLNSLKFILNKNRSYIFPIVTMLLCVLLFFQLIIPQFRGLFEIRKEAGEASSNLVVLKENLKILSNINEGTLDSQLDVLRLALPSDKDFIGMLNSIYLVSQKTGVSLGNFSFKPGELSKSEKGESFPVVKLSVPIDANVTAINSFVQTISKTFPLSEVYAVKTTDTSSMVSLSFYFVPLSASNYDQNARISPISQEGLTLISQLNEFKNTSSLPSIPAALPVQVASSSATQ